MMTMDTLPDAVRRAVQDAPGSARELALEAGIDPSLLTRILTGEKRAGPTTAAKVRDALRVWQERCARGAAMIERALKHER